MFFKRKPAVLFFPINGSGLGHLNRCLAYAKHLPSSFRSVFFSLSPAIKPILELGFEADYFLSPFWTAGTSTSWNRELAVRLGLILEHLRPDALVFDGTYPYLGLKRAIFAYGRPLKVVWSRRGLRKDGDKIEDTGELFDLIIEPGEIQDNTEDRNKPAPEAVPLLKTDPVMLCDRNDLLRGEEARARLGLRDDKKYILFSTGSGNLKDTEEKNYLLMEKLLEKNYAPVWLQSPISVRIPALPENVPVLEQYPVSPYLKAFHGFVAAAGYNSCYEAGMAGLPSLMLPNEKLLDNQKKRASFLEEQHLAIIYETDQNEDYGQVLERFIELLRKSPRKPLVFPNGAGVAANAIKNLATQ